MTPQRPQQVAALRYDSEEGSAPRLVAKGTGEVAERILALAHEHGVPVREDPALLTLLSALDLGKEIPPDLYEAVAKLIVYLRALDQRADDFPKP
jgi:flagellar biosynthesis protein